MATEVETFRDAVNASPELQEEVRPFAGGGGVYWPNELARIAKAHGFEVTRDDVVALFDDVAVEDGSRALSDFELEMVAAGALGSIAGPSTNNPSDV